MEEKSNLGLVECQDLVEGHGEIELSVLFERMDLEFFARCDFKSDVGKEGNTIEVRFAELRRSKLREIGQTG